MLNSRFRFLHDEILRIPGKDLAALLGVDPSAVSRWRKDGREIPSYIAGAMELHAAARLGRLLLPLSIGELIALSRAAETDRTTVEALILAACRKIIADHASPPAALPRPDARRVAETDDTTTGGGLSDGPD